MKARLLWVCMLVLTWATDVFPSCLECDWSSNLSAERTYDSLRSSFGSDIESQLEVGGFLIDEGLRINDCRRWLAGMTLILIADPYGDYDFVDFESCEWQFGRYHYQRGVNEYLHQRLDLAVHSFEQALRSQFDEVLAYTGMGACRFEQSNYDEALRLFTAAWMGVQSPNAQHIMLLNNLAGICNTLGKFEEALKWSDQADDILANAGLSSTDQSWYAARIMYNRWSTKSMLCDTAFIRQNLIDVPWGSPDLESMAWLDLHAKVLNCTGDLKFALRYYEVTKSWSQDLDWGLVANRLGYLSIVHSPEWDALGSSVNRASGLSWLLRSGDALRQPSKVSLAAIDDAVSWPTYAMPIAAVVMWLVLMGVMARQFLGFRRKAETLPSRLQPDDMLVLKGVPHLEFTKTDAQDVLSRLIDRIQIGQARKAGLEAQDLTISEQIVFKADLNSESPKVTAQRNNWSPSYVYFLRTSVRAKLGKLPSDPKETP